MPSHSNRGGPVRRADRPRRSPPSCLTLRRFREQLACAGERFLGCLPDAPGHLLLIQGCRRPINSLPPVWFSGADGGTALSGPHPWLRSRFITEAWKVAGGEKKLARRQATSWKGLDEVVFVSLLRRIWGEGLSLRYSCAVVRRGQGA
ncbi:hypothetical protein AAFF_G00423320 [Aldrovandia affinis]|uniref:Uncharacterized protein n=1 Tax=Aldrovandia affinis TaxID=143900 RepID=A0AAD7T6S8_9TELE|nr:hypothetical protein AAFF_G00423320 [Aldrovandia affinis]